MRPGKSPGVALRCGQASKQPPPPDDNIRTGKPGCRIAYEGRRLRAGLLNKTDIASGVWADTAYRSKANEGFMEKNGFVSHVHRKKPKGRARTASLIHTLILEGAAN
jgi:hypothetical protein